MSQLSGKWALVKSENLDNYMTAIGVTDETNHAKAKEILEKTGEGGLVEHYMVESGKSIHRNFYLGGNLIRESPTVPFNTEVSGPSMDGRIAKFTLIEDSPTKVTRIEKFDSVTATSVSEVHGDEMVMTLVGGGVECKRTYKKV